MAVVKVKTRNSHSTLFKIKSFAIFQIDYINGKKYFKLPFLSKFLKSEKPVFYLKINCLNSYSYTNIQHWIDIIDELGADYYIICDKIKLENRTLRQVIFPSSNIKFIKSIKNKISEKIVKNIATPLWKNATYAHLTPFLHAKKYGIKEFWNIDADDTTLCAEPKKCAEIIIQAQNYARENDISAFSFDMWKTRTQGKHWSFGITFIRENRDYIKLLNEAKDLKWNKKYLKYDNNWNIDWYFNYLHDFKNLKTGSFYVENLMFFHCGDMLFNIIGSYVSIWRKGFMEFPIVSSIFKNDELSHFPIHESCVKFDTGIKTQDCRDYALKNLSSIRLFPKETRALHNISEDFCKFLS